MAYGLKFCKVGDFMVINIPLNFQVNSIYTFLFLRGGRIDPPGLSKTQNTLVQVGLKGWWSNKQVGRGGWAPNFGTKLHEFKNFESNINRS